MFFLNAEENLSENHLVLSLFYRPIRSNFTRVQRSTCLILFLLLSMISNAIYFKPEDDFVNSDLIHVGPLVFSWQSVYISVVSVLISAPTILFIMIMFRKSKARKVEYCSCRRQVPCISDWFEKQLAESRKLEKILISKAIMQGDGAILPWWCCDIAWVLSLSGCLISAFFVFGFSLEWGKQKSEMWLTQFCLSLIQSSVILDPLKVNI